MRSNVTNYKIVEIYDNTVRIEYPVYDYRGMYNGYIAETISKKELETMTHE